MMDETDGRKMGIRGYVVTVNTIPATPEMKTKEEAVAAKERIRRERLAAGKDVDCIRINPVREDRPLRAIDLGIEFWDKQRGK